MSFKGLGTSGLEENTDYLGGFSPLETDIYLGKITMAYAGSAKSGARFISLSFAHPAGEYREQIYYTKKDGTNYYTKDGKKYGLPGFYTINDLCLITTGEALEDQETEDKMVKVYDPDEKKELPKSVPVLTALIGQDVALAIKQTLEDKTVEQNGEWVPTGDTIKKNNIEKVFHPEYKLTVSEATKGMEEGEFWDKWLDRNKGKTHDKTSGAKGNTGRSGKPGGPPQKGGERKKSGLFGKK